MISIGGGAKSPLFNQIKADVLGIPVVTFETGETALLGGAVIAAVGSKMLPDYKKTINRILRRVSEFVPDMEKHTAYMPYSNAYLKAIEMTTPLYPELNKEENEVK